MDNQKVTVTFNTKGGSVIAPQTIDAGTCAVEPKDPTNADLKFVGWMIGKNKFDFNRPVNDDIELVAKWENENLTLDWEPEDFSIIGSFSRINSATLAHAITQKMKETFHDYSGTYIGWDGRNFNVTLFFAPNNEPVPDGKIKNLINLTSGDGVNKKDLFNAMQYISRKYSGETYTLNDETKELLSDLMYGGRRAMPFNDKNKWNNVIFERREPANNMWERGAEKITIGVNGLDLRKICRLLYGSKMCTGTFVNAEGKTVAKYAKAMYDVRYAKHKPEDGTFYINIDQFDPDVVEELNRKENSFVMPGSIQMY